MRIGFPPGDKGEADMTAYEIFAATIKAIFGFDAEQASAEWKLIAGLQKRDINIRCAADFSELRDAFRKASRIGHSGTLNRAGRDRMVEAFWNARNNCSAVIEKRAIDRSWMNGGGAAIEARILDRQMAAGLDGF